MFCRIRLVSAICRQHIHGVIFLFVFFYIWICFPTISSPAGDSRWGSYVSDLLKKGANIGKGGVDMGDHRKSSLHLTSAGCFLMLMIFIFSMYSPNHSLSTCKSCWTIRGFCTHLWLGRKTLHSICKRRRCLEVNDNFFVNWRAWWKGEFHDKWKADGDPRILGHCYV